MREAILKEIKEDLDFLKGKIIQMEIVMSEIDADLHREFNPEYEKKLKRIEKEKGIRFKTVKELDEFLSK